MPSRTLQLNLLQQHPELADVDVRKAMVLLPADVAVRRAVADMNCRHGQVDEAIKELRPLVRSDRVDITLRLAEALRTRGAPSDLNESTALCKASSRPRTGSLGGKRIRSKRSNRAAC